MTRAVESIFAEYQKELWEVYGIFALEGSYETGSYSEELLKERLAYYGASGMDQEITRIQLLTDQGASAFYEQVTAYMENKYGLDKVKKLVGQTDTWKSKRGGFTKIMKGTGQKRNRELTGAVVAEGGISRGRESLIACGEIKKHASCRSDYAKGTCNVKEKYYVIGNGIS